MFNVYKPLFGQYQGPVMYRRAKDTFDLLDEEDHPPRVREEDLKRLGLEAAE